MYCIFEDSGFWELLKEGEWLICGGECVKLIGIWYEEYDDFDLFIEYVYDWGNGEFFIEFLLFGVYCVLCVCLFEGFGCWVDGLFELCVNLSGELIIICWCFSKVKFLRIGIVFDLFGYLIYVLCGMDWCDYEW